MTIQSMENKRLFVGNLFPDVSQGDLEKKFSRYEVKQSHLWNFTLVFSALARFQRLKSKPRKTLMEMLPKPLLSLTLTVGKTELVNAFLPFLTKSKFHFVKFSFQTVANDVLQCCNAMSLYHKEKMLTYFDVNYPQVEGFPDYRPAGQRKFYGQTR